MAFVAATDADGVNAAVICVALLPSTTPTQTHACDVQAQVAVTFEDELVTCQATSWPLPSTKTPAL